ncbi:phospholipase D family protein [Acidovorax sp. Leaf160]|uniref:phospholipase D family protein n=1 Tax=Acidovorax sp. Leaf160 TaxID=1736280 RepID=UPI0006F574A2|nr:phospholipase D family protein [Acidovorax sp. Leaf160]KQR44941.1 phospholipase [Acidovorax sp. Leaf160]
MPTRASPSWHRCSSVAAALLAAIFTVGCSSLPKDVERPISTALQTPQATSLGSLLTPRPPASPNDPTASAFLLLNTPEEAFTSRLALVRQAQKTLDLQYYAIHVDASSERLLRGVVGAARRGVRVRILLDDFHSTGRNALVMRMAFEPNIEMRMFNPVAGSRGSALGRMWGSLTDFARVQQRMHNKLFLADNAMGVTGGRNLGDAYFGNSESGNFVDMDVLAAGPIVREMSRSFDSYWNNERAYPVQSLITREELANIRAQVLDDDGSNAPRIGGEPPGADGTPAATSQTTAAAASAPAMPNESAARNSGSRPRPPDGEPRPALGGPTREQRERIAREQPMDLAQADFVWAPAVLMVDKPTKIPLDDAAAAGAAGTAARAEAAAPAANPATRAAAAAAASTQLATSPSLPASSRATSTAARAGQARNSNSNSNSSNGDGDGGSNATRSPGETPAAPNSAEGVPPGTPGAVPTVSSGDTVVDGLLKLMGITRSDLLIISPYFVPGDDMKAAFAQARSRGVRVRILTNSLASNDAPIAHVGYARHREELLRMGIELYEMRSEASGLGSAFGSSGGSGTGESRAMLHSKVMVIDGRLLVIGSMNLDLRSQLQNTEIALLIRSPGLSREAAGQIEAAMRRNAWRLEHDQQGGLVWRAPQGSGLQDATHDPDTSLGLRMLLKLLGPLAPDHLL